MKRGEHTSVSIQALHHRQSVFCLFLTAAKDIIKHLLFTPNAPRLDISSCYTVESIGADGQHTSKDGETAWPSRREVALVADRLIASLWWQISVRMRKRERRCIESK